MKRCFRLLAACLVFLTVTIGITFADSTLPTDNLRDFPIATDPTINKGTNLDINAVEDMLDQIKGQKTDSAVTYVQSVSIPSSNSFDIFMKIDGIEGASMDLQHRNEVGLISYSFNVAESNKTSCELKIKKIVDKASPKLMLSAASGKMISKAVLTVRKAGGPGAAGLGYSLELDGITATSYEQHPYSSDNEAIIEEVTFKVEKVLFSNTTLKPGETSSNIESTGWDFKTGREP